MVRTLATREVGAPSHGRVPLPGEHGEQIGIAGLIGHVGGSGGEVVGADGVATQHLGLAHRQVVLEIGATELDLRQCPATATLDEDPGLLHVTVLAGQTSQLDESGLDLGMAADGVATIGPELGTDQICSANGDGQQAAVRGCLDLRRGTPPCHRSLEQMPQAVQLVAPREVRPALTLARSTEPRVQVSIGFLGGSDPGHGLREILLQGGIGPTPEFPGHGLEILVDLGIGELAAAPARGQGAGCGEVEVADPALAFEPVLDMPQDVGAIGFLQCAPESTLEGELVDPERGEGGTRGGNGCDRSGDGCGGVVLMEHGRPLNGHPENGQPLNAPDMKPLT
jgi:hypothetical protein